MHESTPPLRQYLRFLKRHAWLIVLVPLVAIALAWFFVSRQTSVYRAEMGIIVAQAGGSGQPQIGGTALTQTMQNIIESDVIARRVAGGLDLQVESSDLLKKIKTTVKPSSSVITVSYDSTDKPQAVAVLTRLATEFKALIRTNLGVTGSLQKTGPFLIVANVYDPPHLRPDRISPQPAKILGFAGALGLALGLVFAFARHSLDNRVRSRHDAEEWFGAPVIGTLPPRVRSRQAIGLSGAKPGRRDNEAVEAIQLLRANFQFGASSVSGPTVLVTSNLEEEGKTTVVANLGLALALSGRDVVCVEGDVRRPSLYRLLGRAQSSRGLVDVIEGRASLDDVLEEIPLPRQSENGRAPDKPGRLRFLPAGPASSTALPPERLMDVVRDLSSRAEYVIFDSSPLLSGGEALPLAVNMDGVLVVAREGRTTREGAQAVRTTLHGLGADKVAVVLIDASQPLSSYTTD